MGRAPATSTVLAGVLTAALCATLAALFFLPVPEANRDQMGMVLGSLLSAVSTVVGFYFGSSKANRQLVETNLALAARPDGTEPGS